MREDSCIKEFIASKRRFQELMSKTTSTLSESEMNDICRYGNLSALERNTNKKIEKDTDLKDKILKRIKK